jgi:hypothetical protein
VSIFSIKICSIMKKGNGEAKSFLIWTAEIDFGFANKFRLDFFTCSVNVEPKLMGKLSTTVTIKSNDRASYSLFHSLDSKVQLFPCGHINQVLIKKELVVSERRLLLHAKTAKAKSVRFF